MIYNMGKAVTLIIDPVIWEKARIIAKAERRSLSAQISVWIDERTKCPQTPAAQAQTSEEVAA
jgi:hypothetical protein